MAGTSLCDMRRSVRVVLFDDRDRLLLIRRDRPGRAPYLTLPGGGVEGTEDDRQTATRECAEELGAEVVLGETLVRSGAETVLLGRCVELDLDRRHGPELTDHGRGSYTPMALGPDAAELALLVPDEFADLVRTRWVELAARSRTL